MYALRLTRWNQEPELVELPTPTPGPGEVLLRVEAAGLCHSDLHMMEWPEGSVPFTLPFTLGHETAGTVAALGPGVAGVREGDRVAVYSRWGCQRCRPCLAGRRERMRALGRRCGGLRRWRRPRRRPGGVHDRALGALPDTDRRPRSRVRRAAHRCRADAVPRASPLRHAIAARRDRPGHRRRRARPHGHPTAPGAQRGADRRGRRPGSGARTRARRRRRRDPVRGRPHPGRTCEASSAETGSTSCSTVSPTTRRWPWPPARSQSAEISATSAGAADRSAWHQGGFRSSARSCSRAGARCRSCVEVVALARVGGDPHRDRALQPRAGDRRLPPARPGSRTRAGCGHPIAD